MTTSEIISAAVAALVTLLYAIPKVKSLFADAKYKEEHDDLERRKSEQAFLDGQRQRLVVLLHKQLESISDEMQKLRLDYAGVQVSMAKLREEHATCIRENSELKERVAALEEGAERSDP